MLSIPFESAFNILLLVVLVSIIARFFRLPYTVALVFAGLLAPFFSLLLPQVSPDIFLSLLLPPVIFQAATHINLSEMRKDANPIFSYAFIGTMLSTFLIGLIFHFAMGFPFLEALLLGAIISPTDPIAVISSLRTLGVSRRLTLIIEGESLFNDGVAVVMYTTIITALISGVFDWADVVGGMIFSILAGGVIGGLIGYITYRLLSALERLHGGGDDDFIRIILTFITMYVSYQLAIFLNGSGIISVAIAGLIMGNFLSKTIPQRSLENLDMVWDFVAFIATSVSFILIGTNLSLYLLWEYIFTIVLSFLIILCIRAITIYSLSEVLGLAGKGIPRSWQNTTIWSGLRGAVSVMLALGLAELPIQRSNDITAIIFGVVFFSVIFQGLTIKPLMRKLELSK